MFLYLFASAFVIWSCMIRAFIAAATYFMSWALRYPMERLISTKKPWTVIPHVTIFCILSLLGSVNQITFPQISNTLNHWSILWQIINRLWYGTSTLLIISFLLAGMNNYIASSTFFLLLIYDFAIFSPLFFKWVFFPK